MKKFHGAIVAQITPFEEGAIDHASFEKMVDWQIANGTRALMVSGSAGEALSLTLEEHAALIKCAVTTAQGRIPIIGGVVSASTATGVKLAQQAEKAGAEALLVLTPYYVKPPHDGLISYFKAIHDSVDIPLIVYNNPSRTALDLSTTALVHICSSLPRIIGLKDATGDLTRPAKIRKALGNDFIQLSGEDSTAVAYVAEGGHGCISTTGNIVPKWCSALQEALHTKQWNTVISLRDRMCLLHEAMFYETNPIPVKYCASLLGLCREEMRPPLTPPTAATKDRLKQVLKDVGCLQETTDKAAHG